MTPGQLVARLVRAGELEVPGEGPGRNRLVTFDTTHFLFHVPDGFEADYSGLTDYFKAIRAAFRRSPNLPRDPRRRGKYIACQIWIEGTFAREFTQVIVRNPSLGIVRNEL